MLETGAGWYRAAFPPLHIEKTANAIESIAPPLTYNCKTPFAAVRLDPSSIYAGDVGAGEYETAEVDVDADGKVIDVTAALANPDMPARKRFEDRVEHMRFTPAVAYCRPVPSTNFLSQSGPP